MPEDEGKENPQESRSKHTSLFYSTVDVERLREISVELYDPSHLGVEQIDNAVQFRRAANVFVQSDDFGTSHILRYHTPSQYWQRSSCSVCSELILHCFRRSGGMLSLQGALQRPNCQSPSNGTASNSSIVGRLSMLSSGDCATMLCLEYFSE